MVQVSIIPDIIRNDNSKWYKNVIEKYQISIFPILWILIMIIMIMIFIMNANNVTYIVTYALCKCKNW